VHFEHLESKGICILAFSRKEIVQRYITAKFGGINGRRIEYLAYVSKQGRSPYHHQRRLQMEADLEQLETSIQNVAPASIKITDVREFFFCCSNFVDQIESSKSWQVITWKPIPNLYYHSKLFK
jgi:hypothetical protein